jgi:4-hydroxymandelate oxidase
MVTLRELEAEARRRLDPVHYDFFAGGADDEITLRRNEAAFARIALMPRTLCGSATRNLELVLLGCRSSMPVLIAPTAFHRLAHPDGECATARAAASSGIIMIASMASTVAIDAIANAARERARDAALWFQLYIQPDRGFTEAVIRCAEDAGCRAVVVTVDSPVLGRRERDVRNGFLDLPPDLCCENMRDVAADGSATVRPIAMCADLSWDSIDWLRETTALPIVLKGILHPADASLALHHGADAIVVSNHGGRQLDSTPATIDLLPEIVDALGGRIPVLVDVVKALALGASAVAIGRPVIWGLAAAGETGVARVLEMLRAELERTLALCGCGSVADVTRDLVRAPRVWQDRCSAC